MAAQYLMQETIWTDQLRVEEAERFYYEKLAQGNNGDCSKQQANSASSSLVNEIARARKHIQRSLDEPMGDGSSGVSGDVIQRLTALEEENKQLNAAITDLRAMVSKVEKLENRLAALERGASGGAAPAKAVKEAEAADDEDEEEDDDIDLFGSDDEEADAAAEKLKQERLAAYAAKKAKKPTVIAKSNVILDVKPWDDETDMNELEKCVRSIVMDGLLWGASKFVPLAYGIKKLQITTVIEDDKVSVDLLEEKICEFEDFVQSVDIAAFNKI